MLDTVRCFLGALVFFSRHKTAAREAHCICGWETYPAILCRLRCDGRERGIRLWRIHGFGGRLGRGDECDGRGVLTQQGGLTVGGDVVEATLVRKVECVSRKAEGPEARANARWWQFPVEPAPHYVR